MNNISISFRLLIAFVAMLFSCTQKNQDEDINRIALNFSDLECRAYTLREERYSLADKIRFAQDSISKQTTSITAKVNLQKNLQEWLKVKEIVLAQSLRLADTIKLQLDTIIKIKLQSHKSINQFDHALSIELERRHCK